jgi:uncharacterized protein YkwD
MAGRMKAHSIVAAGAAALVLALMAGGAVKPATAAAACAHSNDTHLTATVSQLENSLTCLINAKRHDRGRQRLDRNGDLDGAAAKHSRRMVKTGCLSHKCPGEKGLGGRVRDSGYLQGAKSWRYAESTGCALTPKGMFDTWMDSSFHRENILKGAYEDVGIGGTKGSPAGTNCHGDDALTTYTAVFAWRKP